MPRRPLAASRALAIVVAAIGCASPTLPLPPPLLPSVSATADPDMVQLTATSNPPEHDAVIVVINEGGGQPVPPGKAVGGAIADPFGAWQTTVFAHQGDSLVVTYQVAGENSLPAMLTVRLH